MNFGQEICIRAQLLAMREGTYTLYVFKDLDDEKYIMCTKCPNWQSFNIEIFQEGFLTYKYVIAGHDSWLNRATGNFESYQYTANYFLNFIPTNSVVNILSTEELTVC